MHTSIQLDPGAEISFRTATKDGRTIGMEMVVTYPTMDYASFVMHMSVEQWHKMQSTTPGW